VPRASWCRDRADALRAALEAHAWDGSWYRRAYFDDGTPLGSANNDECQIAAIPQAWAVISGRADPERSAQAMAAVERHLVRAESKLIQLIEPPFDKGTLQPGYIKGYVPGVRENGGQYTHGVTWVVLATVLQGRGDRALELWNLLNPVNHATTPAEVERYKVEPYVLCGDVYAAPPHIGRGGWTWYTGSAGWLYRVGLEQILGFQKRGDRLRLVPCIHFLWPEFEITYRHGATVHHLAFRDTRKGEHRTSRVWVDGVAQARDEITLVDDGGTHEVRMEMA
jgi:cellobiose phosphorylase